ncbi:MAG: bifunctional oligoribonuclease/PAP phosphatase NrnA [Candidatus Krumholzibacteriia bacterium]
MPQRGQLLLEPETFLDRLLEDLRIPGEALVVTHDNPDPDSLSSAYGLKALFEAELGRTTCIGYGGMIGRAENRTLVEACRVPAVPLDALDYSRFTTVALVDSQPETGNNSIPEDVRIDLVIDHHPLREQTPERSRWVDVRSDFGASATIVAKYLMRKNVPISPLLATAFFYAIKSETQDLGVEANEVDREVYFHLFPKVDPQVLFEITHPRVSLEYFRIVGDLTRKTMLYDFAAVTYIGRVSNPDFVAEMADMLMRLEGIEWALCMGAHNGDLILSLRTSRKGGGAGQMIQRIVRGLGKAGGHGMMAGGKVRQVPEDSKSRLNLVSIMRVRFLTELCLNGSTPRSIFDD